MTRYLYVTLLAVALTVFALLFTYRTEPPKGVTQQLMAEFGGVSLKLELATTTWARERGLSGKTSLPDDYGMLFAFPREEWYGFWMKDMFVSIDIFWLDSKGQVVSISERVATSSYPTVFYPTAPAWYVLETAAGFAQVHHIATGTPLLLKNLPTVSE